MAAVASRDHAMRRFFLLTAVFLLLLLGLVVNGVLARRSAAPPLPVEPAPGHGQLMANLDLAGVTPDLARQVVGWAADDGNTLLRVRAPWNEIEPEPGQFRWDALDQALGQAKARNMQVVLVLDGAPAWAAAPVDAANPLAPPHDVRDFGRFAAAAAQRYGAVVDVYQVWDEPNIAPHWGARWVSAQEYFNLLREAANSIHAADPTASVMLAALAPATTTADGSGVSDLAFLQQLYDLGAARFFDLAAGQGYGFDRPPDEPPASDRFNFRRPELLHALMARNGDAHKPLWITTWGWWSPANGLDASPWASVPPQTAASYAAEGLALARRAWPWAGPLAWSDYATTPGRDPQRAGFSLRGAGGEPTAAGQALTALATTPPVLGTGSHVLTPSSVSGASDAWRFSPDAADPSGRGAELAASFEGRSVAVEVQRGPYWATLKAWIDGAPAPLLPRDESGDAYIALNDPANGIAVVPLARDLAPGRHELRLQASAGWGQWLLRRVIVDQAAWPRPWPFWPLAAVLVLAALVVGWLIWRTARTPAGSQAAAAGRDLLARWDAVSQPVAERTQELLFLLALLLTAAFYLAPGLGLTLILLAGVALLIALRPELAPPLILVWLPFYIRPRGLGPVGVAPHELLIWLALGFWLLRLALAALTGSRTSSQAPQSGPTSLRRALGTLDSPVLLLLFVAAFATLNAAHRDMAVYEWRTVFLGPVVFYFLVSRSGRAFDLRLLTDGLVVGALAISVLALVQVASGHGQAIEGVVRFSGLYGSPNNLALYLGRVLPLLIAAAALAARTPEGAPASAPTRRRDLRRWLYLAALFPVVVAAFLTFSKGFLFISLPVSLLLLAVLERRLRLPVLVLAVVGGLALLPFLGTQRFDDLANTQSGTTFFRLQLWQSAWRMWLDHPWLGVGPDNFLYAYRSGYVLPGAWQELNLSHPHNLVLDLLTRLGLFGFAAGAWLLTAVFVKGWRLLRSHWSPIRPYYLGLYVGLAAGLAHGLIDNSLFLVDLGILTLFVVAATARLHREFASQ